MTERNSVPPATERAGVVKRLDGADGWGRTRMGKAREISESDNLMVIQLVAVEHPEAAQ
jgi:hypothetical protein